MSTQINTHDIVVIGAGPAGLSAAIYTSWLGLKTIVLEGKIPGGRTIEAPRIENFPGFPNGVEGAKLSQKMAKQAKRLGACVKMTEEITNMELNGTIKNVFTRMAAYSASAVIIATGTQRRKLMVQGEAELLGRGVSYCTICDGPFFKNATVAVVGHSEEAVIDALFLADIAKSVLLVTHGQSLEVSGALTRRLLDRKNVEVVGDTVEAILGEAVVASIRIIQSKDGKRTEREVNGVFIALGGVPMTGIVRKAGVNTDERGCIIVDRAQRTNLDGVYAAGDCTCGGMQVVTAAGEGAMAGMRAAAYVKRLKSSKSP